MNRLWKWAPSPPGDSPSSRRQLGGFLWQSCTPSLSSMPCPLPEGFTPLVRGPGHLLLALCLPQVSQEAALEVPSPRTVHIPAYVCV